MEAQKHHSICRFLHIAMFSYNHNVISLCITLWAHKAKNLNTIIYEGNFWTLSTKAEQLEWRRSKVVELRARGLSYAEIAQQLIFYYLKSSAIVNIIQWDTRSTGQECRNDSVGSFIYVCQFNDQNYRWCSPHPASFRSEACACHRWGIYRFWVACVCRKLGLM